MCSLLQSPNAISQISRDSMQLYLSHFELLCAIANMEPAMYVWASAGMDTGQASSQLDWPYKPGLQHRGKIGNAPDFSTAVERGTCCAGCLPGGWNPQLNACGSSQVNTPSQVRVGSRM